MFWTIRLLNIPYVLREKYQLGADANARIQRSQAVIQDRHGQVYVVDIEDLGGVEHRPFIKRVESK